MSAQHKFKSGDKVRIVNTEITVDLNHTGTIDECVPPHKVPNLIASSPTESKLGWYSVLVDNEVMGFMEGGTAYHESELELIQ